MQCLQDIECPATIGVAPAAAVNLNPRGVQNKWDATCIDRELGGGSVVGGGAVAAC